MSESRVLTVLFVGLFAIVSIAEAQTDSRSENERSQAAAQVKAGPDFANYRAQVVVTDRVDDKVVASDTFNSLFTGSAKLSRSRGPAAGAAATENSAFEISVTGGRAMALLAGLSDAQSQSQFNADDMIRLSATAQLHLLTRVAGPEDGGGDIAQNVSAFIKLGKPYTMVDMVTDRAGRRRVTVQITITRVPVE